ncbi:protoporphyrinogen/coproporphyrinogen oxidase [Rubrivirga sp.]|uniref:protoporphyrinogen/coproporphyrinogen oxidase n=1 Tax=Rubrivirga sp. TaxID=1885344 RepID=UPI003C714D14
MSRVVVVGAGLSGLACARILAARGVEPIVLEADTSVGGRVQTHRQDGFQIDRGFQVLLTAYPEAQAVLDYEALGLGHFAPGAWVRHGGSFQKIGDPFRRPLQAFPTLLADVGTPADKLRVLRLRHSVLSASTGELWARPETTTEQALRERYGFSDRMVDRFFRPFLGGVLLDPMLSASSRSFEVYFQRFSQGSAALPAAGVQAMPEQIAAALPDGSVRLGARVQSVSRHEVALEDGDPVSCDAVVVATDARSAGSLLDLEVPAWKSTTQLAWSAPTAPMSEPVLVLDGEASGPVNNAQVVSNVQPAYAPSGQALVTASVLGDHGQRPDLEDAARAQLRGWFGEAVDGWTLLRIDHVRDALPDLPSLEPPERSPRLEGGLYVTGDWRRNASINGALVAGRHAAEAVLADVGA